MRFDWNKYISFSRKMSNESKQHDLRPAVTEVEHKWTWTCAAGLHYTVLYPVGLLLSICMADCFMDISRTCQVADMKTQLGDWSSCWQWSQLVGNDSQLAEWMTWTSTVKTGDLTLLLISWPSQSATWPVRELTLVSWPVSDLACRWLDLQWAGLQNSRLS